jgi:hypothetical protein
MHLAHLLRSSKQRYMQFSPVLTTVGVRTCTTWRFVYVPIARLRCWLYLHIQFRLNFYTSAGYHCKISLITTGWNCFGCQVTATLRAMRRLIGWRGWARIPTFENWSLVFHWQLQLFGIWIEGGSLTHILNTGSHLTAVDNLNFGLNTRSCKQSNTSCVTGHCSLNKHLHRMGLATSRVCASCQWEE